MLAEHCKHIILNISVMKKIYLFFFFLLFLTNRSQAQTQVYSDKEYSKNPYWISMIKDTSVNFFEAEKAFKLYFSSHDKPEGEQEDIGEHAKMEKYPSKRKQREMQRENHMRMEVKKYEHWRTMILPYVQPDGTILTPAQRIQIWQEQSKKKN